MIKKGDKVKTDKGIAKVLDVFSDTKPIIASRSVAVVEFPDKKRDMFWLSQIEPIKEKVEFT
jgi:hypothetical protein